jgi:hypothetical protein
MSAMIALEQKARFTLGHRLEVIVFDAIRASDWIGSKNRGKASRLGHNLKTKERSVVLTVR